MTNAIDDKTLLRWQASPIEFIETVLHDPESGEPFKLLPAEREFLLHAFQTDDNGRLKYPEMVFGAPKKSGKTAFAALFMLTIVLLFGGRFAEGYALANDEEQAASRVFGAIKKIVECSPLLQREAKITADKITFPAFFNATISTVASNFATAAGANPTISCFDELWGYTSERSYRLWDEMVPPPTRQISCRLTTTYAGFAGESTLLETLFKRGMALPEVGPSLHAGDGLLMAWHCHPIAPWQTDAWLAEMRRSLRPNQFLRMVQNQFVSGETAFVVLPDCDRIVNPSLTPAVHDPGLPLWVGIDASTKHDSSAIVGVSYDAAAQLVRLCFHRIYQPSPDQPLDFEATIERTLLDLKQRFQLRKVLTDPYQMASTMQRLVQAGVPVEEYPQSSPNLTAASQCLYDLIKGQGLVCYPDEAMRLAISRCIASETPRGWKISKERQSHKIDCIVALAMAAYGCIQGQAEPVPFDSSFSFVDVDRDATPPPDVRTPEQKQRDEARAWQVARFQSYVNGFSTPATGLYSRPRNWTWR